MINNLKLLWEKIIKRLYGDILSPYLFDKIYSRFSCIQVKSIPYTVNKLMDNHKSLGRFGDGELSWMLGKSSGVGSFQTNSKLLASRLKEVLSSDNPNFMIALPDAMTNMDKKEFTSSAKRFWRYFFIKRGKAIYNFIDKRKTYYNTSVTRPYIDYNENNLAKTTFSSLKKVWKDKNILIIEGSQSRLGYNDDLFSDCNDIKRIQCPMKNAFDIYEKIYNKSLEFLLNNDDYLVLISLGPTATILSYDLCNAGFRAIDIGHIDVEYEWYMKGAKEKISLPDKYVSEAIDGRKKPSILTDTTHDNELFYKF